jgi:hypothetical protein
LQGIEKSRVGKFGKIYTQAIHNHNNDLAFP